MAIEPRRDPEKPAPDTVAQALRELAWRHRGGVCRRLDVDLETVMNAGMDVIPVCWGFRSREFFDRAWSGE